jgi:hypothetical protein
MKVVGRVSPNPAGGGSPARSTPLSANQAHEGVRTVATVTVAAPLRSITNQASTTTRTGQDMTITFRSAAPDTDANPTDETHREHAPNPCITRVAFGLAASALALMSAVVHADQNPLDNGQPVAALIPVLESADVGSPVISNTLLLEASFEPMLQSPVPNETAHLASATPCADGQFIIPGIIDLVNPGFAPCGRLEFGAIDVMVTISYSDNLSCLGLFALTHDLEQQMKDRAQQMSNNKWALGCESPGSCIITNQLTPGTYHTHVQTQFVTPGCTMRVDVCARIEVISGSIGICSSEAGTPPVTPWQITPPCGIPQPILVPEEVR